MTINDIEGFLNGVMMAIVFCGNTTRHTAFHGQYLSEIFRFRNNLFHVQSHQTKIYYRWIGGVCIAQKNLQSLGFTVNRVLIKLFKSSNTAVIEQCRYAYFFRIELPSLQHQRSFEHFLTNAAIYE